MTTTTKLQAAQDFVDAKLPFTTLKVMDGSALFLTDEAYVPEIEKELPCGKPKQKSFARLTDQLFSESRRRGYSPGQRMEVIRTYKDGDALLSHETTHDCAVFQANEWEAAS